MKIPLFVMSLACATSLASSAWAQSRPLRFYYQNVPLWTSSSPTSQGGLADFNRFRVMAEPSFDDFTVEIAYEQVLTASQNASPGSVLGGVPSGGEWLPLQWELYENDTLRWAHRFDRLNLGWAPSNGFELKIGRQAVSWATTLFLTPADPFSPFDPADPFRVYRAGVDVLRVQAYPGPLSEIDVVIRATETERGEELTALGRALSVRNNWELSGWGGLLRGDLAASGAAAGSVGATAIRAEAVVQQNPNDAEGVVFRGTVGLDRRFSLYSRDLFFVAEFQHDGFGAASPMEYAELFDSDPFRRGQIQVLGRNELAFQANYQWHPLWSIATLWLLNASDSSSLLAPSFSYSASDMATVSGGAFFGLGDDTLLSDDSPASEYGLVGTAVYLSVSLFF